VLAISAVTPRTIDARRRRFLLHICSRMAIQNRWRIAVSERGSRRSAVMESSEPSYLERHERVTAFFQDRAAWWAAIYAGGDVEAAMYRARQTAALAWVDALTRADGARALEIGCGAGFLAVALAQRGYRVTAIDASAAMVDRTRRQA